MIVAKPRQLRFLADNNRHTVNQKIYADRFVADFNNENNYNFNAFIAASEDEAAELIAPEIERLAKFAGVEPTDLRFGLRYQPVKNNQFNLMLWQTSEKEFSVK